MGDYDRAIPDLSEPLKGNWIHVLGQDISHPGPRDTGGTVRKELARTYFGRGLASYEKDEFDRTIADLTEAVKLEPTVAVVRHILGHACLLKGDSEGAFQHLSEASRLDPGNEEIRMHLSQAKEELGR